MVRSGEVDFDWNYKKHHRIEIDRDCNTTSGAFMMVAHPRSAFSGPAVATFTEEQARELYEKLGKVLEDNDKESGAGEE